MEPELSIDDLYPNASAEEKRDAERRLESYLRVVLSIAAAKQERLLDDARLRAQDDLRSTHYEN